MRILIQRVNLVDKTGQKGLLISIQWLTYFGPMNLTAAPTAESSSVTKRKSGVLLSPASDCRDW